MCGSLRHGRVSQNKEATATSIVHLCDFFFLVEVVSTSSPSMGIYMGYTVVTLL